MSNLNSCNIKSSKHRYKIVWRNVVALSILHMFGFYGLYMLVIEWKCQLWTFIFQFVWALFASFGITGGAHRLWAHNSYKAKLQLRILYAILMSMIFANDIYTWVRDHRAHHKFSETNADPHNAKRGFFFSHIGWLMVRRHPDVISKGSRISYEDLQNDPVVMFHRKYYMLLMPLGTFILPSLIPWYFWYEEHALTFSILRYIINIHIVWSLNSFAHLYGNKPYDKNIYATENTLMMYLTIGEGFHNYHHVFPWDYKAAELGSDCRNFTKFLIQLFAKIGWANKLKTVSKGMIKKTALRTGDGSWQNNSTLKDNKVQIKSNWFINHDVKVESQLGRNYYREDIMNEAYWGWDDPDISHETKKKVIIL